jgi:hypothetical protein
MAEQSVSRSGSPGYPRLALFVWGALYFGARAFLENGTTPWIRVAIALAPLPAFIWFLRDFIRGLRGLDELERRIQLEALAVAFPLTVVLIMTLGLVQIAVPLSPDDWSYRHLWPLLFLFYLAGLVLARRRYQ